MQKGQCGMGVALFLKIKKESKQSRQGGPQSKIE
jgi:hypothetical protein